MIKLVCADPFLHNFQKKQNQHLNVNYDMASPAEHKTIINMIHFHEFKCPRSWALKFPTALRIKLANL